MSAEEQTLQTVHPMQSLPPAAASMAATTSESVTSGESVPNLLRQYEETLTLAISPRSGSGRPSRRSLTNSVINRENNANTNSSSINVAEGSTSGSAAAATYHPSPRAVYHSPHVFVDNPPELPMFSPKRRSHHQQQNSGSFATSDAVHASAIDAEITSVMNASFEDDENEAKAEDGDDVLMRQLETKIESQKSKDAVQEDDSTKEPSSPQDSEGCLICMDEFSARRKAYPLPCTGQCTGAYVHYRCIMAWLGQSGSCPLCRGVCDPLVLQPMQKLELQDMHKTALQPVPLDAGIIRCYVKQVYRGMFKQYGYELYLQGQIGTQEEDRFLLAARRQVRSNMTANYVLCTDKECTEANRIGRMGSNFLGTCFTLYDNGRDPQKIAKIQDAVSSDDMVVRNVLQIREELGCVTYEPNRTSVGPRKMRVVIPDVDENGVSSKVVRPMSRQDRLVTRLSGGDLKDLMKFSNREPVFREDLGAYCLDFGGRVSMASVKNFQLINTEDPSMGNILQFGRVADDMFTMDFQWPLSPFQAFAICLSSCDTKLACV
uniref:RING-type domain-containing protein n=1 Tax=Globisporangium ultimum (strain ATCC 200006 / CBS 805.95 / DAOM BR144) TaxID=431595 RepID=K3WG02_GLOUD